MTSLAGIVALGTKDSSQLQGRMGTLCTPLCSRNSRIPVTQSSKVVIFDVFRGIIMLIALLAFLLVTFRGHLRCS